MLTRSLIVLSLAVICLCGCQPKSHVDETSNVKVRLMNTDQFPKELVGHWVNDSYGWELWIGPEGKVRGILHTMARVRINPEKVNTYQLVDNGTGRIDPGEVVLQYDDKSRELVVEITLDDYEWVKQADYVGGHRKDVFIGNVSDDNMTWPVLWLSKEYVMAGTDIHEKRVLTDDPELKEHGDLVFEKVLPETK